MRRRVGKFEALAALHGRWRALGQEHGQVALMAAQEGDAELQAMAQAEMQDLLAAMTGLEQEMRAELLRPDEEDSSSAILELRAGTGGDEAAIFSSQLFAMYKRYAELNSWHFEELSLAEDGPGALRVQPCSTFPISPPVCV